MLSENIKKFRKKLELSQEELARKANITYSTGSPYKNEQLFDYD